MSYLAWQSKEAEARHLELAKRAFDARGSSVFSSSDLRVLCLQRGSGSSMICGVVEVRNLAM